MLNQSTKQINHASAKHYRIAQAFIRFLNGEQEVKTTPVNTADNESDIFTKALPAAAFLRHRATLMGPQECPD